MASSATTTNGGADHVVELVSNGITAAAVVDSLTEEEAAAAAAPLLQKPKINIFTISYSTRKPKEHVAREVVDLEVSVVARMVSWIWSGSKYSGFLCVALSSLIYFFMAVLSEALSGFSWKIYHKQSKVMTYYHLNWKWMIHMVFKVL